MVLNNMDFLDTNTSFMLTLDHLDVNYVSNLNSEYEGVSIPLWSTNGSKSRRYGNNLVEFQVLAGKRDDLNLEPGISDDDINTGCPTYKCVICDADIPSLYRKEHNNSAKHRTCLKIVEAVLLRIHSHILTADEIVCTVNTPNTYFCDSCNVVVKNKDKIDHETSTFHQKSLLHDCCLNDFLNIYLDKSYLDSPDIQYMKSNKLFEINRNITKPQEDGETKSKDPTVYYKNKAAYDLDPVGDSNDSSNDENGNTIILPVQQKAKKKRKRPDKKQKLDLKNFPPIEAQNSDTSKSDILNLSIESYPEQNIGTTNEEHELHDTVKVKNIEEAYKNFPNMFQELNLSSDELDNLVNTTNETISNQNSSKDDIDNETDSIDEEYHSLDELNNTVKKQCETDAKNNSNDEENSSNKHEKDQNNKEDQHTNSDENCPVDQNKTDKLDNSTVDYIMLVNSNEFDVDTKKYSAKKSILNESDLEKYLKTVNSDQIYLINEDYIRIVTKDGSIVTVRADNFNGFYVNDGKLECRVCMARVNEDATVHIYNVQHMKYVRTPLEDRHCYREINDPFKHCIHCNDTFCNFDIHKNSDSHIKSLNESIERTIPSKPVDPKKAAKTYCEPCDLYIDSHNFNSHTNGKLHKQNLSLFFTKDTKKTTENVASTSTDKTYCNECNSYVLISTFAKHLNQHANTDKINKDNDKIYCEACHLYIGKNNFPSHVYGKTHQASLVVAKVDTSVGLTMKNYCKTCKIYVENMSSHITGAYHEFHLNKTNTKKNNAAVSTTSTVTSETNSNYQIVYTENGAVCMICAVKVPNNPDNIKEHTNGRVHKSNYNLLLNNNKIKLINNKLSCEACKVTINVTAELDHIQSKSHKLTLSQIDKTYCDLCKVFVLNSNWTSHLTSAKHNATKETNNQVQNPSTSTVESNNNNNLVSYQKMCRVCDVKIPSRPDLITEHTNGKAHRTKFNALLDENKFKIVNDRYFCDVCKIAVPFNIIEHIQDTAHKNSLAEVLKPQSSNNPQIVLYHCDACDVDVLNTPATIQEHKETFDHKISDAIVSAIKKEIACLGSRYHFESTDASDFLKCKICDININATDSTKHSQSPAHISKYETVLRENKIQKVNDKFLCQICSVEVKDKEELKHIRSPTHLFEKQAVLSSASQTSVQSQSKTGYRCAVCQVNVPNNPKNIAIHDRGSSHMAKLKNLTFEDEEKVLMTRTDSGREMVCSLCKVTVPISGVSLHVRGAKHRANKVSATT